jgi:ribose-phosphate pyrophosphokinase
MLLHLDPKFKPFASDVSIDFQSFTFSGGEPHIKIDPNFDVTQKITITHRINSFNDLGLLCIAVDALHRMDAKNLELFIPYFPGARQDRVMVLGEALTVKVYADIINSLQFNKVYILDAHSEVTPALVNHCEIISNHTFVQKVIESIGTKVKLISPDGGALKKVYKLSEYLGGLDVIECSKCRDVKTGKLSGFKVQHDHLQNEDCLIVDDICDGGGTFVGLAEELKKKQAGKLYLAVSHGIFSRGLEVLNCFEKVFTTNSVKDIEGENVEVIKFCDGLLS